MLMNFKVSLKQFIASFIDFGVPISIPFTKFMYSVVLLCKDGFVGQ